MAGWSHRSPDGQLLEYVSTFEIGVVIVDAVIEVAIGRDMLFSFFEWRGG